MSQSPTWNLYIKLECFENVFVAYLHSQLYLVKWISQFAYIWSQIILCEEYSAVQCALDYCNEQAQIKIVLNSLEKMLKTASKTHI